jgi:hypothetical protein
VSYISQPEGQRLNTATIAKETEAVRSVKPNLPLVEDRDTVPLDESRRRRSLSRWLTPDRDCQNGRHRVPVCEHRRMVPTISIFKISPLLSVSATKK